MNLREAQRGRSGKLRRLRWFTLLPAAAVGRGHPPHSKFFQRKATAMNTSSSLPSRMIVTDSSSDLLAMEGVPFASAPLKIVTAEREYIDDESLDTAGMVEDLRRYSGKSSTSCPNPEDFIRAFGEAEEVFCVTITGTLSGCHNCAMLAKKQYEEAHPGRRVFVLDSLSTGPEMALILQKIREGILAGRSFEEISAAAREYSAKTGLIFMLESLRNLANNGRVSPVVAKMAGILGIRLVAIASERGDIEPVSKCRGEQKALSAIVERMRQMGHRAGKVRIAHCMNEGAAHALAAKLRAAAQKALDLEIVRRKGRAACGV